MKLGLSSASYAGLWGQDFLNLRDFLAKASSLGYEAVTLMGKRPHLASIDLNDEQLGVLAEDLKRLNLRCPALTAYTDFAHGESTEAPFLEMQIAYIESLCRACDLLGANIVRVFTGYESSSERGSRSGLPQAWKRVTLALREVCERAARFDVTIAVQNHHDVAVHTDALLELLADVDRPNCKLAFDAWSPFLRGEPLYEAARKAAPHMVLTTNADFIRLPRHHYHHTLTNYTSASPDWVRGVPFGVGGIDFRSFFQGLMIGGFDGLACYEMASPLRGGGSLANLDRCAAGYLNWMREHKVRISPKG